MAEDDLAILSWLVILVHRPRIGTPGRERRKTLTSNAKIRSEGGANRLGCQIASCLRTCLSGLGLVHNVNKDAWRGAAMAWNRVQFQKGLSEVKFEQIYGTEEQCRAVVITSRWPNGFECPGCGGRD
jgi:hypothetical protein